MPGPQRVSDRSFTVDLRHHIFPWAHDMPVMGRMQGTNDVFLPVFSNRDLLVETMIQMQVKFDAVKQIDDPNEFIALDQVEACVTFMRKLKDWATIKTP